MMSTEKASLESQNGDEQKIFGVVEKVFPTYGFILAPDGQRYFFHFGMCISKPEYMKAGDFVEFSLGADRKTQRIHAQKVRQLFDPCLWQAQSMPVAETPPPRPRPVAIHMQSPDASDILFNPFQIGAENDGRRWSGGSSSLSTQSTAPEEADPSAHIDNPSAVVLGQCQGFCVFMGGVGAVLELSDHSSIVLIKQYPEGMKVGEEYRWDMVAFMNKSLVRNLRRLPTGLLSYDFVVGAGVLTGRVVKELDLDGGNAFYEGLLEQDSPDSNWESEFGVRRLPFTLMSLALPQHYLLFQVGVSVTFNIQAEGADRRPVKMEIVKNTKA